MAHDDRRFTQSDTTTPGPLQMLRAEVNVQEFHRWAGLRRLQDPDHAMHCLLKETFRRTGAETISPDCPRAGSRGCLYGYGRALADGLLDAAHTFADPQQLRALPPSSIDSKPMPSEWQSGKRLGFELRVRPVLRKSGGSARPGSEQDVFRSRPKRFPQEKCPTAGRKFTPIGCPASSTASRGQLGIVPDQAGVLPAYPSIRKLHSRLCRGAGRGDARRPHHNRPGCFRPAAGQGSGPAPGPTATGCCCSGHRANPPDHDPAGVGVKHLNNRKCPYALPAPATKGPAGAGGKQAKGREQC